jgi:hypothetical protein
MLAQGSGRKKFLVRARLPVAAVQRARAPAAVAARFSYFPTVMSYIAFAAMTCFRTLELRWREWMMKPTTRRLRDGNSRR